MSSGNVSAGRVAPSFAAQAGAVRRCRRILLAEKDITFRALLSRVLRRDGHQIVEAADGAEVLELLATTLVDDPPAPRFDLIVTDVRMPGWPGLDILAGLRHYPVVPAVVLIAAFGDERFRGDGRRLGALATLDRPFPVDDLREIVDRL